MARPTERQKKIAELRNQGLTQEEIATKLGIARSTVARDWSSIKSNLSFLPLGYEEAYVIHPTNQPDMSASIVVDLDGFEFEKLRESKVIYSKSKWVDTIRRYDHSVFEPRTNNIVHLTPMGLVESKFYADLATLSLKHSFDAIDTMRKLAGLFFDVIASLKPSEYSSLDQVHQWQRQHHGDRRKVNLAKDLVIKDYQLNFKERVRFSNLFDEEKQQSILEAATLAWKDRLSEHFGESRDIINALISINIDENAYETYFDLKQVSDNLFAVFMDGFEGLLAQAQLVDEAMSTFRSHKNLRPDMYRFYLVEMSRLALIKQGIHEDDLYIAIEHKIAEPGFLSGFINSGVKSVEDYQELTHEGFTTADDRNEFYELWETIEEMAKIATVSTTHENLIRWLFRGKKGDILKLLRRNHWTKMRLIVASEIYDITKKHVDFSNGQSIVDSLSGIEWPSSETERQNLRILIDKAGFENLRSWLIPKHNPLLIKYAIDANLKLNYSHARPTFEAMMERGHLFEKMSKKGGLVDPLSESFVQNYGLGWAKSDLNSAIYLILDIVRKSHGNQMPLTNLLRQATQELGSGLGISNEEQLKNAIEEHLGKFCVVQPNDIVQIKGRKKQPVDPQQAIEDYETEKSKIIATLEHNAHTKLNSSQLAKHLGVSVKKFETFFSRVEDEDIDALRLARVIRDDDLPQACHLVWRYFVYLVDQHKPSEKGEEDVFVYDIDFAAEHLELSKAKVNLLHEVRKIRNHMDHPGDEGIPNPTWKRVAGVLDICEIF